MNGKGDTPRPLSVSRKEFENNWELAFGKKHMNVPDPLPLRKVDVPMIEGEVKPLEMVRDKYGVSVLEKFRKQYWKMANKAANEAYEENKRGLRESVDNTSEASGSTIQPPS